MGWLRSDGIDNSITREEDSIISELRDAQMRGHPFMVFRRDELPSEFSLHW